MRVDRALLARRNKETGEPQKITFGPWMLPAFRLLAKLKGLRGTAFDPFGRTEERKTERRLIADYEKLVDELLAGLTPQNHALAIKLASIPDEIRGYGHIKDAHLAKARRKEAELLAQWRNPEAMKAASAGRETIVIARRRCTRLTEAKRPRRSHAWVVTFDTPNSAMSCSGVRPSAASIRASSGRPPAARSKAAAAAAGTSGK